MKKAYFFDLGRINFSMFRHRFFSIFRYFYSFSAPKRGVQSIPRVVARLLVFFSSQTDKISLNFDNFFDFFDVLFSAHQIQRWPRTDRPRAHRPTGSWAHEPAPRDPELTTPRPTTSPRAHELVGPRACATRSRAEGAPTDHGPTGPRARGPTSLRHEIRS